MKRYVIESHLPGVGSFDRTQLKGTAVTSNEAAARLKVSEVRGVIDPMISES
jgi:hypothetical protein